MNVRIASRLWHLIAAVALSVFCFLPETGPAQYRTQSLQGFEGTGGGLPEGLLHGHNSTPYTTRIVGYADPSLKSAMGDQYRRDILGDYALGFTPVEQEPHLSIVHHVYLDRGRLGQDGVALLQADFFLPPEGANHHTFAILASKYDPEYGNSSRGYRFYRFGIQTDRVYFSFTNNTATPVDYRKQDIAEFNLRRPGWHRLQMAFQANGQIFCYVDGNQTNFSPIDDQTLMEISPGLMVTRYKDSQGTILADNLAMLWSPTSGAELPPSPWTEGVPSTYAGAIQWDRSGIQWYTRFSDAWHDAETANKHILVFAHTADEVANEYGLKLLESPEAGNFMKFVVPLRVNISTEYGRQIAAKMGVTKIQPTFLVLKPNGTPFSSAVLRPHESTWPDLQRQLTNPN